MIINKCYEPYYSRFCIHTRSITMWNTIAKFVWIVVLCTRGSIDTPTIKKLTHSIIPQYKITKLMEDFSQIAIDHLTHIIINKRKLGEKKNLPTPLNYNIRTQVLELTTHSAYYQQTISHSHLHIHTYMRWE